jgi:hypothetical protein
VKSLSLWLPIGFHAGWNYSVSGLLGTTMSGQANSHGLLNLSVQGPSLFTGGAFGIEASAVAVFVTARMVPCVLLLPWRGKTGPSASVPMTNSETCRRR